MVSSGENFTDIDKYADALSKDNAESPDFFVKLDENTRPEYVKRLGDVIDDAVRLGWIDMIFDQWH